MDRKQRGLCDDRWKEGKEQAEKFEAKLVQLLRKKWGL